MAHHIFMRCLEHPSTDIGSYLLSSTKEGLDDVRGDDHYDQLLRLLLVIFIDRTG